MPTRPARSHHRAGRLVPLATAALLALLAACAPHPTPSATVTATPSSTPSPALPAPAPSPTQPPDMSRDDETGAVAAARFFLTGLYPYTVSSQDTASWDGFSAEICNFCRSLKSSVAAEAAADQRTVPGAISIKSAQLSPIDALRYRIDFEVAQGADVTYSSQGLVVGGRPARTISLVLLVVRNPGQWLIGGIEVLTVDGVAQ